MTDVELEDFSLNDLPIENRETLEADCFWCFSKLLDGIQDNYTFAQPGIQKRIKALENHISRIDSELQQIRVFASLRGVEQTWGIRIY